MKETEEQYKSANGRIEMPCNADKPKRQFLVVFCAILVAIPSLVILLGRLVWLVSLLTGGADDKTAPVAMPLLTVPALVILPCEYLSVIRRSAKATLTVATIYLMGTALFELFFMVTLIPLLGIIESERTSSLASDFYIATGFLALSSLITFAHFRWYFLLKRFKPSTERIRGEIEYIGFGRRFIATMIDCLIFTPILHPVSLLVMKYSFESRSLMALILYYLLVMGLFVFLIARYGGAPGKLLVRIRIVDNDKRFLTIASAILRYLIYLPSYIIYLLAMNSVFSNMPISEGFETLKEFGEATKTYGGVYSNPILKIILSCVFFVDVAFILFTRKKRAIHDYIAGSHVISKESYEEKGEPIDAEETESRQDKTEQEEQNDKC